jgi:hypothetical protein
LGAVVLGGVDGGEGSGVLFFFSSFGLGLWLSNGDDFHRGIFSLLATRFRILILSSSSEEMTMGSGGMVESKLVFGVGVFEEGIEV